MSWWLKDEEGLHRKLSMLKMRNKTKNDYDYIYSRISYQSYLKAATQTKINQLNNLSK